MAGRRRRLAPNGGRPSGSQGASGRPVAQLVAVGVDEALGVAGVGEAGFQGLSGGEAVPPMVVTAGGVVLPVSSAG